MGGSLSLWYGVGCSHCYKVIFADETHRWNDTIIRRLNQHECDHFKAELWTHIKAYNVYFIFEITCKKCGTLHTIKGTFNAFSDECIFTHKSACCGMAVSQISNYGTPFGIAQIHSISGAKYPTHLCPECRGTKQRPKMIDCSRCYGNGGKICRECNGAGNKRTICALCQGHGTNSCPWCDKNGCARCVRGREKCFFCENRPEKRRDCNFCNHTGTKMCTSCDGAGRVMVDCAGCDGKGLLILCSTCGGKKMVETKVTCDECE